MVAVVLAIDIVAAAVALAMVLLLGIRPRRTR